MRYREIVLFGPGKNALGFDLMQATHKELEDAAGAPILLRGEGDALSAGLNIKEVIQLDADGVVRFLGALDDLVFALYTYPGPTVACIDGHAIAGGCVLALACDVRVAQNDDAIRIGLNETALGLVFPPKILALLRARLPPNTLDRLVLEAGLFAPKHALALGLVDEVVSDARAAARARIELVAQYPREAYAKNKQALRSDNILVPPDDERRYLQEIVPMWVASETKSRLASILKR
jgi:enoyl-CoA hydratase/carnithine racemase